MLEPLATPKKRPLLPLATLSKALIIPLAVALMGVWTDYRLKREKLRADAGYETMAPAMKELQKEVATLGGQVQVLQQLVLVLSQNGRTAEIPALATFKDTLVVKVQKSQGRPAPQAQLPTKLDDVVSKK